MRHRMVTALGCEECFVLSVPVHLSVKVAVASVSHPGEHLWEKVAV